MAEPTVIPGYSGCDWPLDPACLGDEWDELDEEVQDRAAMLAHATLRRLTGYRVGGCPVTVRPCKTSCGEGMLPRWNTGLGASPFNPHISESGFWVNSCGCSVDCACDVLCEIELPAPVGAVYDIKVDGLSVSPDDYRIDGNRIVWTGVSGDCPWPACQDMAAADTEVGTFSITYLNAWPVDALGSYAAGVLAMEFAKACAGAKGCRLPAGVTAVSRQGISYEIASGSFPDGFTTIREVDAYIALFNPDGLRQSPKVWYPGIKQPRVVRA